MSPTPTTVERASHRVAGDPTSTDPFVVGPVDLLAGAAAGELAGLTLVVKDLYDVAGTRTGAGNPVRLAETPVAEQSAPAVTALCAAGAHLVGKTVTDELAFSLSGTNVHYGTPLNPAAPDRVPGGSSSGSASAVASALADLALGTDTGGSVRVPASYCGIYGLRTTHGRISRAGVVLLAPSFCTVGVFARSAEVLGGAWRALRDRAAESSAPVRARTVRELVYVPDVVALADDSARRPVLEAIELLAATTGLSLRAVPAFTVDELLEYRDAFRALQMYEAYALHGRWVRERAGSIGPGIAARFAASRAVSADDADRARARRAEFDRRFAELLGDGALLVQPAASGPAPPRDLAGADKDDLRARTLALTAIGGLAGAPVVSLPMVHVGGLPLGLGVVGRAGDDDALIELAGRANEVAQVR